MFKNFTNLNESFPKALPPNKATFVEKGLSIQSGILGKIREIANEYTKAYNSVSVIKYDESGNPIDVTPAEKMSVAENRLASVKAWIEDSRTKLSQIREMISSPSTTPVNVADVAVRSGNPLITLAGITMSLNDWLNLDEQFMAVRLRACLYNGSRNMGATRVPMKWYFSDNIYGWDADPIFDGITWPDAIGYSLVENTTTIGYRSCMFWISADSRYGLRVKSYWSNTKMSDTPSSSAQTQIHNFEIAFFNEGQINTWTLSVGMSMYSFLAGTPVWVQATSSGDISSFTFLGDYDTKPVGLRRVSLSPYLGSFSTNGANMVRTAAVPFLPVLNAPVATLNVDDVLIPDQNLIDLRDTL